MKHQIDFESLRLSASSIQLFREQKYSFLKKIQGRQTREDKPYFKTGGFVEEIFFNPELLENIKVLNFDTNTKSGIFLYSFYQSYAITKDKQLSIDKATEESGFVKKSDIEKSILKCEEIINDIEKGIIFAEKSDVELVTNLLQYIDEAHELKVTAGIKGSLSHLTLKELLSLKSNEHYIVEHQAPFEFVSNTTMNKIKVVGFKDLQIYDVQNDHYIIIDLKTSVKAKAFENAFYNYGYDIQETLYMYEPKVFKHTLSGKTSYYVIVADKSEPFTTDVYDTTSRSNIDKLKDLIHNIDYHISNPELFYQTKPLQFKPWHQ